jgi:hypothetical protein
VPTGVVGEMAKLPVLSRLSVKVMPTVEVSEPTVDVGVSERVSTAIGEASTVTGQVSAIPSGASYLIAVPNVGARGVA